MKGLPNSTASKVRCEDAGTEAHACGSRGQRRHLREVRLIEELAELHDEAAALIPEVVAAGKRLHETEHWAGASFDEAATSGDDNAVDRAVAAALESDRLRHAEAEAMGRWVAHRVRVEVLLERVAAFLREAETA